MAAKLHLAENALALHLLLESLERLINVVVANDNLHEPMTSRDGPVLFDFRHGLLPVWRRTDHERGRSPPNLEPLIPESPPSVEG